MKKAKANKEDNNMMSLDGTLEEEEEIDCTLGTETTQFDATNNSRNQEEYSLLFSLRITDGTYTTDIIFHGANAEACLQTTAEALYTNQHNEQQRIERQLAWLVQEKIEIDVYLKLYAVPKERYHPNGVITTR